MAKLLKKGFATEAEKLEVKTLIKALEEDKVEEVKEEVEKVEGLPEVDPAEEVEGEAAKEVEKSVKKLFEKVEKDLGTNLDAKIKEAIREQIELREKKVGVYNKELSKDEKRKKVNVYLKDFMRALGSNDVNKLKELSTDATGSPYGGYVVDSELSAEIRHLVTEYGVARREMTNVTLSKNSYKANNLATDVTVYWVDEGSAISSTQVVLGQETLELKKLAAIVAMTSELLDDEEIDLMSFVGTRVAEGFAEAEDTQFFNGDGTTFTGLLQDTTINEVTMTGSSILAMDADDLIDMVDATPQGALGNAKYYLHRSLKSVIRKLKDDNGAYIYQAPSQSGPATIWGYPEVLVEAMPSTSDNAADTSFVLFGDLKKACILGNKGAIKAKMFDAGTVRNVAGSADINLITTDREAIRWTERVGYITIIPSAVTKLTTAAASA